MGSAPPFYRAPGCLPSGLRCIPGSQPVLRASDDWTLYKSDRNHTTPAHPMHCPSPGPQQLWQPPLHPHTHLSPRRGQVRGKGRRLDLLPLRYLPFAALKSDARPGEHLGGPSQRKPWSSSLTVNHQGQKHPQVRGGFQLAEF